jgi:transcription termination factor Rho
MSLPPKSDDETSAPEAADKPVKRGRPRTRKPAAEPEAVREEPKAAAIFVPEPRPEPAAPVERPPAPQQFQEPSGGNSPRDVGSDQPASSDGGQGETRQDDGRQNGGRQGQGGGHGEWQDRNQWKRNKRKRGRHGGGPWQPGGGGGAGGGGAPRYPQQPPPPTPQQVYGDLPDPARFADLGALDALAKEISSGKGEPLYLDHLYGLNLADLIAFARGLNVPFEGAPNRLQLLPQIFAKATEERTALADRGYIDQSDQGFFIVHEKVNYRLYPEDAYLPESLVRRYGLKRGHQVDVLVQPPRDGERCPSVIRIDSVMGKEPEEISKVTPFEELIPYYPLKRILLEDVDIQKDVSMRAVDILTPIGFGQRGLIVAPPRTGKTILLQNIANSISENSPFAKLILLLVDERPEEVTDFRRHTKGEVVSSTFDESPESHVHAAEMVGEKARRLVEQGEHVVILLDSITRLARAYNALAGSGGKIMSGGLESNALQKPKRFFGAARNIEGAGSLTIIGTALVDTGSRADEIIFEEFKGTGNMELHLDRGLVERRIFPAINIDRSGTRKEELIYHPEELQRIYGLRRAMQGLGPIESMEMLIQRLKKTKSNAEFLLSLSRQ